MAPHHFCLLMSLLIVAACCVVARSTPAAFPKQRVLRTLEENWATVGTEARSVPRTMLTEVPRLRYDWGVDMAADFTRLHAKGVGWVYAWHPPDNTKNKNWLNFGLIVNGQEIGQNSNLCPATTRLLKSLPVHVVVAGFSLMKPHSVIHKHSDYQSASSRSVHMGIDIPNPNDCGLSIHEDDGAVRTILQRPGRAFSFDSRKPHWAFNFSEEERIILYMDIEPRGSS